MRSFYLFLILCGFATTVCSQQKPLSPFQQKVVVLKRILDKQHYSPRVWNDTTTNMFCKQWIRIWDKEKMLFTQTEIDKLDGLRNNLNAELEGKSWGFVDVSQTLYTGAIKRADSLVKIILAKPIDISKPDDLKWPINNFAGNNNELLLRWRQYLKWEILREMADRQVADKKDLTSTLPKDYAQAEIAARNKKLKQYEIAFKEVLTDKKSTQEDFQDKFLNTIAWTYDPHSAYMNMTAKKSWDAATSASEYSAGLELEENERGEMAISFLQPGGSAWRSGKLFKGDILLKIKSNGKVYELDTDLDFDIENLFSGDNPEPIEITVKSAAGEVKTVLLQKEKITDEAEIVKSFVINEGKKIGYIQLPGFYSRGDGVNEQTAYDGCANDVSKEIVKLKKDGIEGLILDLRFNGGGSMWEAMQLAGIFIDIGTVASVKSNNGKITFLKDPNRGSMYDGPLLILINGASASASEFVSAALQDHKRALIVGGTSYGKGTAQVVLPLDTNATRNMANYENFTKFTTEKFYRIDGTTVQWKGVEPDITLPDIYSQSVFKEKSQPSALMPDISKAAIYTAGKPLPITSLKTKSDQRTSNDNYFTTIKKLTSWMEENSKSRIIPLQWESYVAFYHRTNSMFEILTKESKTILITKVSNNGFDQQKMLQAAEQTKASNNIYIKNISEDHTIKEAYSIITDWLNN